METNTSSKELAYIKAQKRIEELKGFYWHVIIYLAINIFISKDEIFKIINGQEEISTLLSQYSVVSLWVTWGIILLIHGVKVFGSNLFKSWEEKKIQEFMNQEKQ